VTALPKLADCPPVPAPDRSLQILSVTVEGCQLSGPFQGDPWNASEVDSAIAALLSQFNYRFSAYRGWKRLEGSRHCVAVKVY
jgi:hypothetical protein